MLGGLGTYAKKVWWRLRLRNAVSLADDAVSVERCHDSNVDGRDVQKMTDIRKKRQKVKARLWELEQPGSANQWDFQRDRVAKAEKELKSAIDRHS